MVGKHAAAFRHRCLGATRCAEEIEQVVRSTSRSVYLNGCLAAKSGICAGCGSSTPLFFNPPPARFEACLGWAPLIRHNYARLSPLQAQCDALFPATAQCTTLARATAHTAVHIAIPLP